MSWNGPLTFTANWRAHRSGSKLSYAARAHPEPRGVHEHVDAAQPLARRDGLVGDLRRR